VTGEGVEWGAVTTTPLEVIDVFKSQALDVKALGFKAGNHQLLTIGVFGCHVMTVKAKSCSLNNSFLAK
jgi:hypothetical protein